MDATAFTCWSSARSTALTVEQCRMTREHEYEYKAFLSYSHEDERFAGWLHRALESFRLAPDVVRSQSLPSNRLGAVFRDRDELPTSSDLRQTVTEALHRSEYLVVLCSPSAALSRWVNEEIRTFANERGLDHVLCGLVRGEPEESFPPALRRPNTEPLAADFRKTGDGKSLGKLKLISGLMNVGLDTIRRRELQIRYRRLAVAATGLVLALALTTVLTMLAIRARDEAENERDRAQFEVETLRGTGDLLIDLYDDGADSLTARALLDRALAVTQGGDYPVATRARMMHTIARIYINLHEYEIGLDAFETSLRLKTSELPADHATVAVGLRDLGKLYGDQLELEPAVRLLNRARAMYARLHDDEYEADCVDALGNLYLDWRRNDEAEVAILEGLAIRERIGDPFVVESLNNLGTLHKERGEFSLAEEAYNRALVLAAKNGNTFWEGATKINLAESLARAGKNAAALSLVREGRSTLGEKWARADPQDAAVEYVFGLAIEGLGRHEEAAEHYRTAIERVLAPNVAPRARAIALLAYRRLAGLAPNDAEALATLREGVERIHGIPENLPDYVELKRALDERAHEGPGPS